MGMRRKGRVVREKRELPEMLKLRLRPRSRSLRKKSKWTGSESWDGEWEILRKGRRRIRRKMEKRMEKANQRKLTAMRWKKKSRKRNLVRTKIRLRKMRKSPGRGGTSKVTTPRISKEERSP